MFPFVPFLSLEKRIRWGLECGVLYRLPDIVCHHAVTVFVCACERRVVGIGCMYTFMSDVK